MCLFSTENRGKTWRAISDSRSVHGSSRAVARQSGSRVSARIAVDHLRADGRIGAAGQAHGYHTSVKTDGTQSSLSDEVQRTTEVRGNLNSKQNTSRRDAAPHSRTVVDPLPSKKRKRNGHREGKPGIPELGAVVQVLFGKTWHEGTVAVVRQVRPPQNIV